MMSAQGRALDLIGAPFDGCGKAVGSRLGPNVMRLAGLAEALKEINVKVASDTDAFDYTSDLWPCSNNQWKDAKVPMFAGMLERALDGYGKLASAVETSINKGNIPVMLAGDHSNSIGSVSGALRACKGKLGIIWIDAHIDLNTPCSSPSGNVHGMPVAALMRMPIELDDNPELPTKKFEVLKQFWPRVLADIVPQKGIEDEACWLGLRDVDRGEVLNMRKLAAPKVITMQDVDHIGVISTMEEIHNWLIKQQITDVWVSFDVDALDPIWAPGTGTAVRGGFSYREGHLIAESLYSMFNERNSPYKLAGLDLVEVSPLTDKNNETAVMAVEWAASLFGRTVLHQYMFD